VASAWGSSFGKAWGNAWGGVSVLFASLGGSSRKEDRPRTKKQTPDEVAEALPPEVVSRLRGEMLSAAFAEDVIARAREAARVTRRKREEETALLLMI
jgi:hypothetical protein